MELNSMEVSLRSRCQDNYEKSHAYFGGESYAQADESTARRLTIPFKIDTFSTILQLINPLASPKLAVSRYQFVLVESSVDSCVGGCPSYVVL